MNLQGDVVGLVNTSGSLLVKYSYNAWGENFGVTDANGNALAFDHIGNINPLRYRGYYYDRETGWYYLQSRYYDPLLHRFINADSFASTGAGILGTNMFAYCNNNPMAYRDDSGHAIWPTTCVMQDGNPSYSGVSQRTWTRVPAEYDSGYFSDIESGIQDIERVISAMSVVAPEVMDIMFNNIDASVGVGQGLYLGGKYAGTLGIGVGAYANYGTLQLKDGKFRLVQETCGEFSLSWGPFEGGFSQSTVRKNNMVIEDNSWFLYNDKQESITIASNKVYFLFAGFSYNIGFDLGGFINDVKEMLK